MNALSISSNNLLVAGGQRMVGWSAHSEARFGFAVKNPLSVTPPSKKLGGFSAYQQVYIYLTLAILYDKESRNVG